MNVLQEKKKNKNVNKLNTIMAVEENIILVDKENTCGHKAK